ncbi:MAG: formylmethanofuran dehydrogenase subunit C [Euryarchaeota archaeon]|nr:formylmethanofuran dehydrogenase subunit C [Euryarchaeota archaeon]
MAEVTLTPKGEIGIMIEAEVITPDIFAEKSASEIENLLVWQGPTELPLSEFFDVKGDCGKTAEDTSIVIDGDVPRVKRIGAGMTAGKITINGSAGMHVGSEMSGGEITVNGDANAWAGMEMKGGVLHITGNAKDHAGCAYRGSWHGMSGGRLVIDGDADSQVGGGMSGGEIEVLGSVQNFCGIRQNGGLIVIRGNAVRCVGAEMSGGTIVVEGAITNFLAGFEQVGAESDLAFDGVRCPGEFLKFSGDYAIIAWTKGTLYASKSANEGL